MPTPTKAELQEIFQYSRLDLALKTRLANSMVFGDWDSAYLGDGYDFEEFREFRPGDSRKRINAPLSSRMGKEMIIRYREPREARLLLVVDISNSMFLREKLKIAYAAMSMVFASAVDIHMPVALWALSDNYELHIQFPFTNRDLSVFDNIITGELDPFEEHFCTQRLDKLKLDDWYTSLPGGSFIFLISDFLGTDGSAIREILQNNLDAYQVVPVVVQDELEYTFVDHKNIPRLGGMVHFSDTDAEGASSSVAITKATAQIIKEKNEDRFAELTNAFTNAHLNPAHLSEFNWEHINRELQEALDEVAAL